MSTDRHDNYDDNRLARRKPVPRGIGPFFALLLVLTGIALGGAGFWVGGRFFSRYDSTGPLNDPNAQLRVASPTEAPDHDEQVNINLYKKLTPSVVNVDIVQRQRVAWDDRPTETQTGAGSGFIWDDEGRMVTNYHVIAEIHKRPNMTIRVVLADGTAHEAVLVGEAPAYDLAVLKFAPHDQPSSARIQKIELGTSHDLQVGQNVFAIGNPFGLDLTMTKGIISALNRDISSPAGTAIAGAIQTDAPINPGNSGGPLLDKSGRLIGVNTAITTPKTNGGNIGIGFAIPADTVNQVVTQIIQSGRVLRPDLGIKLFDQQKLRRARFDHGVMVEQTTPEGPAAKAGLQGIRLNPRTRQAEPGDLITAINAEPVNSVEDYQRILRKLKPGESTTLKITRKDAELEVALTVGGV